MEDDVKPNDIGEKTPIFMANGFEAVAYTRPLLTST
jgi:hypothetical protein